MNLKSMTLCCLSCVVLACEGGDWSDLHDDAEQAENQQHAGNDRAETEIVNEVDDQEWERLAQRTLAADTVQEYNNDDSARAGVCATEEGCNNNAAGNYSVAIGSSNSAIAHNSVAIGVSNSTGGGYGGVAIGLENIANGYYSTSLGRGTKTENNYSLSTGYYTQATGYASTAMGYKIRATNAHTFAIGLSRMNDYSCNQANSMCIMGGKVGIATSNPRFELSVKGTVEADELIVQAVQPDYVFGSGYDLMTLEEVDDFIKQNNHLPGIPSAQDVAEFGVSIGDSHAKLLQKIEELTLHLIEQNKTIKKLERALQTTQS